MLFSTRRAIALTCVVFVFVLLTGYQSMKHNYIPSPFRVGQALTNGTIGVVSSAASSLTTQKPFWTTEQLEPRFAYVQYATDIDYLCNAVMNFHRLSLFGAKHDQILIFPDKWTEGDSKEAKAIKKIKQELPDLVLRPFGLLSTHKGGATWAKSLTKFHAFDLTDYTRVLAFDSDSQVLNSMDHYFLAPMAAVAVPRAYWLNEKDTPIVNQVLGSHVMLIEPNKARYDKIVKEALRSGDFDMEVMNHMFKDSAMILPHRRLALLTGEFRRKDHKKYLAPDEDEEWNAMGEVSRAYLVHFSDWPLPKPWKPRTDAQWQAALPDCPKEEEEKPDRPRCADRTMWSGIYNDFKNDRAKYCKAWL
ncbi:glucose n-acetyltransferase [Colletotrichum incanum]|uniref:Glucose n-acetyltransferase n=1 Tax=Colletotrichum incanum TaxID=1573173 RepID=A0A166ZJ77_COLIC|nr:glucose n-acetyltransferase [Colletotrichum incanum]